LSYLIPMREYNNPDGKGNEQSGTKWSPALFSVTPTIVISLRDKRKYRSRASPSRG
jgi:hypothetical protein